MTNPPVPPTPLELDLFLRRLVYADWRDEKGPIRFRGDLSLTELAQVPFLVNARHLLTELIAAGGVPTTATGNFNRQFVRQMSKILSVPELHAALHRRQDRILNEMDFFPLHILRVICTLGRLVAKRKKRFVATTRAHELLPESQAGELYRHLFITFFRDFDLRYPNQLGDAPGIQQTLALILWRLSLVARDWVPVASLPDLVLLPPVQEQIRASVHAIVKPEWVLSGYAIRPLVDFGLLDRREPKDPLAPSEQDVIRLTPLFERFISFVWDHSVQWN